MDSLASYGSPPANELDVINASEDHQMVVENEVVVISDDVDDIVDESIEVIPRVMHYPAREDIQYVVNLVHSEGPSADITSSASEEVNEEIRPKASKRKKSSTPDKKQNEIALLNEDEDDGSICMICLDSWDICGVHRLTSLKCGHLFGHSCIKRWVQQCPALVRSCPTCKKKTNIRDFRFIYAKKITVNDNTELHHLKTELEDEKTKSKKLEMELTLANICVSMEKQKNVDLLDKIRRLESIQQNTSAASTAAIDVLKYTLYRLHLEKSLDMGRDAGCRVMAFNSRMSTMIVSQKSNQPLFPGFRVRLIDLPSYRQYTYLHISSGSIRDITIDEDLNILAAAAREKTVKIYNLNSKVLTATLTLPNDDNAWSCCFDQSRTSIIYLGSNKGTAYAYDIRQPNEVVKEFTTAADSSPIISIASIPPIDDDIPFGGFLVCKLMSIWFFEFLTTQEINPVQLNIEGPFYSMYHDVNTNEIVISCRSSSKYPNVRYIVGSLTRRESGSIHFKTKVTIQGSRTMQMMIRSGLSYMPNQQVLLCGYLEDQKYLSVWNTETGDQQQSLSVNKVIYDIVPFKYNNSNFLGGVTESDVKLFKFNEST